MAAGGPWRPVGFNDYRMTSLEGGYVCDPASGAISDRQLAERLDRVRAGGGNTVRTWFFQPYWERDPGGPGAGTAFDRLLDAASQRGLRVIPVLTNHWADCEDGAAEKDRGFYARGWRRHQSGAGQGTYRDYVRAVAQRYEGDPTIAFWQLVNEPEAADEGICDEQAAARTLASFARRSAAAIRSVDRTHLISLGTIGGGQCGTAGRNYMRVHRAVDICELHIYDTAEPALPEVRRRVAACGRAGKPTVAGEVGIPADVDRGGARTGTVTEASLRQRARLVDQRLEPMLDSGLDGFLIWQLGERSPAADGPDPFEVGPCDPLLSVPGRLSGEPVAGRNGQGSCAPPEVR